MNLDAISAASGSIASALNEVSQIEQQLQQLTSGTLLSPLTGARSVAVRLPAAASSMPTSGQRQFVSTLSADTGLHRSVVRSWLVAEESGGSGPGVALQRSDRIVSRHR
ncbi:MAG TPA: hypothetical protein VGG41_21675 [Solirubrobacteraceae bacterium]|jgi:hypothetical protein